jgi:hypothetical protein
MSLQSPKVTIYDINGNPLSSGDNSVNSSVKIPVLNARANTSAPIWTDGYMVPLSVDTSGNLRITGTIIATSAAVSATGAAPPASATYIGGSVTTAAPTYTTGTMNALSLTTTGLLRIDGSSVTQPISAVSLPLPSGAATETTLGTRLADATFTARINTLGQKTMANSTPVVLASDQSVIPVGDNGGSLTVDGTVTANAGTGNFNVIGTGTAGTAATGVVTIQGIAGGVAIPVSGTVTATNPSVSTTGTAVPASATYIGGEVTTAAPTYTNNTLDALSLTTTGLLRVDGSNVTQPVSGTVTANIGTSGSLNLEATQVKLTIAQSAALGSNTQVMIGGSVTTAAPTYTTGNINPLSLLTTGALRIDNSSWIGSTAPTVGSKTSANSIPVVIASDQGSITVNASATVGLVDNAAFTDGTTRVQPSGYIFDEVAGTALTENDTAAARIDSKRAQIGVIEDGTTRGTRATVKAASTAAVAGDTALVVSLSPNTPVKSTIKPLYGTNNQTVTITLASLTNTSARASTSVDNTTTLYDDVYIFIKYTTAAAATSATGYVNVYGYGTVDGGTTYPEGITGTDAAPTLSAPPNLTLIGQYTANANAKTYTAGPFSFCRMYGLDRLPARWGVVFVNQSGATLNATAGNFAVTYQGVNGNLV